MSERFFSPAAITSDRATLDGTEAHHLLHVMRAKVGDRITLFDGSGAEFDAVIDSLSRSTATLHIAERRAVDRELPFTLSIGVALPKGDRQKWLVEKLTELGATSLVPLATDRAVAQPTAGALERLQRATIEAAKQCGRNRLLQVEQPRSWTDWLRYHDADSAHARTLVADHSGSPLRELDLSSPCATRIAVGPEGGLTDSELAAARAAGWKTVSLGPRILRVETAAVALAAAIALQ